MIVESSKGLEIRGPRLRVLKNNAANLRRDGKSVTPESLADLCVAANLSSEKRSGHHNDYSGGTEEGARRHTEGVINHIISVLRANPFAWVKVHQGKDPTCISCAEKGPIHCDIPAKEDNELTEIIEQAARRKGYRTKVIMEPHPLNRERQQRAVMVPAIVIQEYVLGDAVQ